MNYVTRILTILFLFSIYVFLPLTANAHKLRIFAWPEGDIIYGETAFSGDRKPKNAEITIQDAASHTILLTTRTDEQGKFNFTVPQKAVVEHLDLLLVVNAGEGHRGEWPMEAAEYLTLASTPDIAGVKESTPTVAQDIPSSSADTSNAVLIDEQLLRRIVDEELEKKLTPLRRILAESKDSSPGLRDILGGIGYILGLAGILAWLQAKKQRKKE
jgi:nickel transport protein